MFEKVTWPYNCNALWAIFKYEITRVREEGTREEGGSSFNISSSMSNIFTGETKIKINYHGGLDDDLGC